MSKQNILKHKIKLHQEIPRISSTFQHFSEYLYVAVPRKRALPCQKCQKPKIWLSYEKLRYPSSRPFSWTSVTFFYLKFFEETNKSV